MTFVEVRRRLAVARCAIISVAFAAAVVVACVAIFIAAATDAVRGGGGGRRFCGRVDKYPIKQPHRGNLLERRQRMSKEGLVRKGGAKMLGKCVCAYNLWVGIAMHELFCGLAEFQPQCTMCTIFYIKKHFF